jgi:hypothetical protein
MPLYESLAQINWLAVVVAAVVTFVIGAAWYSKGVFGAVWMTASGMTDEKAASANMGRVFGGALLFELLSATVLAMVLGPDSTLRFGALTGLLVGAGFGAANLGVVYLFEHRPMAHFLVNAGYVLVSFTVMGAIIGVWH